MSYSGIDNLEVMKEAVNYNSYLCQLVHSQWKAGDKVMEFGAGAGTFAAPMLQCGADIICVEQDEALCAHLRSRGLKVATDIKDIADASMDYIYTLNVLEHIEDDQAAVHVLAAKLKPSGRMLVYCPAFEILFSSMDKKVGHFRRYRKEGLTKLLSVAGLRVTRARYADSLGFLATLLYQWVGSSGGEINRTALIAYDRLAFPIGCFLDHVVGRWMGKNVLVLAVKP